MASQLQNSEQNWRKTEFKYDRFFFEITFGIVLVVVAVLIGFVLFPDDRGYQGNLYTTILGVLITIFVLDRRAERREKIRAKQELKERMIRQMRSSINNEAIWGVEELEAHKWLKDGSLHNAFLAIANLEKANLEDSNLQGADLTDTNLQEANLPYANLQKADFEDANLQKANLT